MIRHTSIEAYNEIKEEGLVGRLQFEVYSKLFDHGPMTQGELSEYHLQGYAKQGLTPRFAELAKMGIIAAYSERPCKVTGRTCLVWDVTDKLPVKPEKKESKDQKIARLETEIAELKAVIAKFKNNQGELF